MVNGTRSRDRVRDEEISNNNRRVLQNNSEKGKIKSHSNNVADTSSSGVRKSCREKSSSKKMIHNPSATKKTIAAGKQVSGRVEEEKMPSPLRRSDRARSHSSISTSDSKSSGSLSSNPKPRKEKSVRQLISEAMQVDGDEEYEVGKPLVDVKRMTARMYRSLFELPEEESNRINQSNQGDNSAGGKINGCPKGCNSDCKEVSKNGVLPFEDGKSKEMRVDYRLSGPVKDLKENTVTPGSFEPSNATTYETLLAPESIRLDNGQEETLQVSASRLGGNIMGTDRPSNAIIHDTCLVPERVQPDCCRQETVQMLLSSNSLLDEDLIRNSVGHDSSGEKLAPSKRKGITVDMDSDVSATLAKGDNCNLIPVGSTLPQPGSNIMETDGSCSKRTRLNYNLTVSESCNPSATELQDGDYMNASMQNMDSQIDNESEAGLISKFNSSVVQPKEKLSSHNANKCTPDSVRFVEYWVPVHISNVQLEQYCDILLKNASVLRSSSKGDSGEAVRDVLNSVRKCCTHPYLIFPGLKESLAKDLKVKPIESLALDLKVSAKMQLLDSMLEELRKNDLRVLILFQSIGGLGKVIGNYLDDLLQQKFGSESYERIDKTLPSSKKQAAIKIFNDKDNRRFVFLLETCACLPSIKLSSVDTIIILDSDWNPMNDIRSLQKLTLDSQFEFIKIFRLYSSFTVEEKALMLAKQNNKTVDFNLQNINWINSHKLLMWGASFLFDELKAFHDDEASASDVKSLFGQSLLKEAMHEFSSLLSRDGEHIDSMHCSTLLKVQQNATTYHVDFPLLGELKLKELEKEPPQFFWARVLEGKQFQWKYLNSSSQRSRKKVHPFDGSVSGPDLVNEGVAKKRRKVSNNIVDQPSSKFEGEKLSTGIRADKSQGNSGASERKSRQHDERRNLHRWLKPEITKLCDVLLLPDNVKSLVDNFLEYVMNNHHVIVNREPLSILQAFQLSLCWTSASLLKLKLDHKNSLKDAENNLNFRCKIEEVDYMYSRLRCLKKLFLHRTENYNDGDSPKAFELFKRDMSKSIKEIQKKCEKNLKKLQLLQEEEKGRLRGAIEEEMSTFVAKYELEMAVIRSCSPNDVMRMEKLRLLNIEYEKQIEELRCQHELCLKALEDRHLTEIQTYQEKEATWVEDLESWAQEELGAVAESLQMCDQVQTHNALENLFAEGKGHDDKVEAIKETVTENSPLSDKRIANIATVSLLDREDLLGLHGTVKVTNCPENSTAMSAPSSMEQKSDGSAVNEFSDRELRKSSGPDNNTPLSPQHQNYDGVPSSLLDAHIEVQETSNEVHTVSVLKGVPVETPGMVNFTDCPQNPPPLNPPSSMDQISDRGSLDAPDLDRVLSPRACQAAASTVVPYQNAQLDPNSELDSHLQEVVHPASNSDPDTVTPSEVRMQSTGAINSATPWEINYQHMQAETHSTSRMLLLSHEPLKNELIRIQKAREQTMKCNENMKLQLKTEFEKELGELRQKYDVKFQEIEVEYKQTKTTLDTSLNIVLMNRLLADAFRCKCSSFKASSTSEMLQDPSFAQQQLLLRQQNARWPSQVAGSSCGPSVTGLQSPSPTASCQLTSPPIRGGYGTPGFVSNVSPRVPINNIIPSPAGNLRAGDMIRAPAPHLQPYRP